MSRKLIYLILFVTISFTTFSQWNWQSVKPQGNDLNAVFFISESVGWMSGKCGTILKTTDGGNNWNVIHIDSLQAITSIYFVSDLVGYCATDGGLVLKTYNGGNTWDIKKYDPLLSFTSLFFTSTTVGWIGGERKIGVSDSTFFKTTDGGESWVKQTTIPIFSPWSIHFFSENYGWMAGVGFSSNIYRTTNGGMTWEPKYQDGRSYTYIFSTSETNAYVTLNFGEFRRTTDGGNTWELYHVTHQDNEINFVSQFFISESVGWLSGGYYEPSGYKYVIFKTTDGGKNLQVVKDGLIHSINSLHFVSENIGWGVGNYGFILSTTDGGSTWIERSDMYQSPYRIYSGLDFISSSIGWAIGSEGCILKTSNGGNDWLENTIGENITPYSIDFISDLSGWISGSRNDTGIIFHTTNGGQDWIVQYNPSDEYSIKTIQFISENIGLAVGNYAIYRTANGGQTWGKVYSNQLGSGWKNDICFINENIGWILGADPTILKTTDGGLTWDSIQVPVNTVLPDCEFFLSALQFVSSEVGWVVGAGRLILKTTDGGISWQEQMNSGNRDENLFSVYFISENIGWTIGSDGLILKTIDGGNSWSREQCYTSQDLFDIIALTENEAWIVGAGGVILSLSNASSDVVEYENKNEIPDHCALAQNYPNPFNPETIISYQLPMITHVELKIFDLLGREIATLVDRDQNTGTYDVIFDGNKLSSGIYICRMNAGKFSKVQKMILLR